MADVNETGLERSNGELIGFVAACFLCSAIDRRELHEWCLMTIDEHPLEALPQYIFELAEFEGFPAEIYKVIGFVPTWSHDEDDIAALYGIALKRGRERHEWPVPPKVAAMKLAQTPRTQARFESTFPFIKL